MFLRGARGVFCAVGRRGGVCGLVGFEGRFVSGASGGVGAESAGLEAPVLPENVVVDDVGAFWSPDRVELGFDVPEVGFSLEEWDWGSAGAGEVRALDEEVFGEPLRVDIVHRVVEWQRARRRKTLYWTKRHRTISGGGRKPHPQKGLGRARQGSIRNPHFRGGVKAHGPVARDWDHKLNKKIRRMGMRVVLSSKRRDGRLFLVSSLPPINAAFPKTSDLLATLNQIPTSLPHLLLQKPTVLVAGDQELDSEHGLAFQQAARNIKSLSTMRQIHANCLDLLRSENLVLTPTALRQLTQRLRKNTKKTMEAH